MTILSACAVTLLASAAVVSAGSGSVTPWSYRFSYEYDSGLPECVGDDVRAVGTVTEFGSGTIVETAGPTVIQGADGMTYSFELSDGRHVDGDAAAHFTAVFSGTIEVHTDSVLERRTIRGATGEAAGTVMIHYIEHVTYHPITDTVSVSIEDFRFTCG